MDNFTILILTTYLYALFLLMLRIKVSFKAIQLFKSFAYGDKFCIYDKL